MSLKPRTMFRMTVMASLFLMMFSCASLKKESRMFFSEHPDSIRAIVDVNLITMETDAVLEHQTVIVKDERVFKIGPSDEIVLPEDSEVISGRGKYLIPGLVDMHVHISDDSDLLKFLKYGVTSVRYMADVPWWAKVMGFSDSLSLREKIRKKEIIGPDIFTK